MNTTHAHYFKLRFIPPLLCALLVSIAGWSDSQLEVIKQAELHARQANQAFIHCNDFLYGWLAHRDPNTGLIPRNLTGSWFWNARDAAADNYPFLVLTSALVEPKLFNTTMIEMLETETKLTNRLDNLPDDYDFGSQGFRTEKADLDSMIFGGSEYVKDGIMPLTEWLGQSPWFERMVKIQDSIWKHAPIQTPFGSIPSSSHEVNGEQLQVLCRLYWMTKNESYREYAFRLADYYMAEHIPTDDEKLRLRDHGCEVIGGLSEAYYLAAKTDPDRHRKYQPPIHRMLDTILKYGRNQDGMFYNEINPKTKEILNQNLSDNWGYNYNAFLTVDLADGTTKYHDAVHHVLTNIHKYLDYDWEHGSSDGYADSIEGGLNLLNRISVASALIWIDQSIQKMFALQRYDGIIEGWHGDGNFARTAIMYAFYKSQGTWITNWRKDVRLGGVMQDQTLYLHLSSDWKWQGKIRFDSARHRENLNLPDDYPRINQFPEWFTVNQSIHYEVTFNGDKSVKTGKELREGLDAVSSPDTDTHITIKPL